MRENFEQMNILRIQEKRVSKETDFIKDNFEKIK